MAGHLKELRVTLEDNPGSLAKLAEALGKGGVNIDAIAAQTSGGSGDIRVLVENTQRQPAARRGAFHAASAWAWEGTRCRAASCVKGRPGLSARRTS